jgi:DegV family protein with EDD domain
LSSHFEGVVSVNVTSKVSGTYNAAVTAADRALTAPGRIQVVDSLNASIGEGLLVMYAAECAARGLDAASVIAMTKAMIPRTRTFALIGSLVYAVRGGRVKPVVKSLADALRLTPILSTHSDGRIAPGGVLFGRRHLRTKFVRFIARRMASDRAYRIGVGHANAEAEGREILAQLQRAHPRVHSSFLTPLGSALSVHGGPGTLVVGVQELEEPQGT